MLYAYNYINITTANCLVVRIIRFCVLLCVSPPSVLMLFVSNFVINALYLRSDFTVMASVFIQLSKRSIMYRFNDCRHHVHNRRQSVASSYIALSPVAFAWFRHSGRVCPVMLLPYVNIHDCTICNIQRITIQVPQVSGFLQEITLTNCRPTTNDLSLIASQYRSTLVYASTTYPSNLPFVYTGFWPVREDQEITGIGL